MRQLPLVILLAAASLATPAQRAWRGHLKPRAETAVAESVAATPMQPADSGAVSCSGFEKTLRSGIESFFVTNHTDSTLTRMHITLEYSDMGDRQLHRRSEAVAVDIPAGETRRVEIKSFDRQATFYYHLSAAPRTRTTATPFKVRLTVDSLSTARQ